MSTLIVPALDPTPYPSLGGQVCDWIEQNLVFGPGDLRGEPARLDAEKRALIWRAYEVWPRGHRNEDGELDEGRRRFKRVAISLRKGSAKTEWAAWVVAAELHPDAPVRCVGWTANGEPIGGGVRDPYIPMVAYTEEQTEELAYGALKAILENSAVAKDFDIGLERIMRVGGDGKAEALSSSPNANDGARTTFQHFDEALALDTPLPTPTGWTTMGDVKPGDEIFGTDGKACKVLGKSDVHVGRPCYRVTFADGSSIVTDEGHLWYAHRRGGCGHGQGCRCAVVQGWKIRRTAEMQDVTYPNGGQKTSTYHIPVTLPLELPPALLPIEPYVMGLWLGDGDKGNATITVGNGDLEQIEALLAGAGCSTSRCKAGEKTPLLYISDNERGYGKTIRARLRALNVHNNKHIPPIYLRASKLQRLALLQGLMDSDGHATPGGWCTFVTNAMQMAQQVAELARTLGFYPTINARSEVRSRTGEMVKVSFQTSANMVPFRLPRKVARCNAVTHQLPRHAWRAVVAIEPVESVPVQCLAVDADDHLFVAGEGLLATHNTHRFTLPRLKRAHQTMMANIPKRKLADAWSLETTTAFSPGEGSIAEATFDYARQIADGKIKDASLFFFHRQASDNIDICKKDGSLDITAVRSAVVEASGPVAEWSDLTGIVDQFKDPTADLAYLQRVWLNRPLRASGRAFDAEKWRSLANPSYTVPDGELIALGFDGSRHHDSTAIVATEIATGYQWLVGIWERPPTLRPEERWEVDEQAVKTAMAEAFERWQVWRLYADPPYWETAVAEWAGEYGEERVMYWRTNRTAAMAGAIRSFDNAIKAGELSHDGDKRLAAHIGNACRRTLTLKDDQGVPLWTIYKERPDSPHKIDAAMAAALSWEARRDAIAAGVTLSGRSVYEERGLLRWWEADQDEEDADVEKDMVEV